MSAERRERRRWGRTGLVLAVAALGAAPHPLAAAQQGPDKARAVAERLLDGVGGRAAWEQARFVRFTFVRGERRLTLAWDRWTGRYRLDATNEDGRPYVVLMNVETREGDAYVDGRRLAPDAAKPLLDRALRVWAGETYWLLMPFKLFDPGVVLEYAGEESSDGETDDVLHVRFENVGLTPGDEFWIYVRRSTGLVDRWRFRLESGTEGDFGWSDWRRFGGILLATTRTRPDGTVAIRFEDITVAPEPPPGAFDPPGAP